MEIDVKLTTVLVFLALSIGLVLAIDAGHPTTTLTVFLPVAGQGSQPLCISNRTKTDLQIPHGPTIHPGKMITATVERDFEWGFPPAEPSTDRQDVDCVVIQ
jgi:hypothetical protein